VAAIGAVAVGVFLLVILLGDCGASDPPPGAAPEGDATGVPVDFESGIYGGAPVASAAPEFAGLGPWFNTPGPLALEQLSASGYVVLVDFWTYTCVNCLRTLPFLRDWHQKYADSGLVIVGVHAPEFEFEEDPDNVARAIEDQAITYPVAMDNDRETWSAFQNNVWPAKYLVGADGTVAYRHFGEGDYLETEQAIRDALTAEGHDVSGILIGGVPEPQLDPDTVGITRELYFGYARNYFTGGVYAAQGEYYDGADAVRDYEDPGPPRAHNVWYVDGTWANEREALVHARATQELEDYVTFRYAGRTVNPVFHPAPGDVAYDVVVTLDGFPLTSEQSGPDVTFDAEGRSIVRVDEPRMYRVLELPALGEGVLRFASNAEGFAIYSVTFGAYTEGP